MLRFLIWSLKSNACSLRMENLTQRSLQSMGSFIHSCFLLSSSFLNKYNVQYFSINFTASFLCFNYRIFAFWSSIYFNWAAFLLFSFTYPNNALLGLTILMKDWILIIAFTLFLYYLSRNCLAILWIIMIYFNLDALVFIDWSLLIRVYMWIALFLILWYFNFSIYLLQ